MGTPAIPDDVVELILLRLDSPICLLRAASTCKQWRRVVAAAGFLCRFRSLHGPPPVPAVYYDIPRKPRQHPDFVTLPPHAIDSRFFSLDFLPDSSVPPWVWRIEDSRGSLLLLDRLPDTRGCVRYCDMVICEPLTRNYVRISPRSKFTGHNILRAHLLDGEAGGISISNFRVVSELYSDGVHYDAGMFVMGRDQQQSWCKISIDQLMHTASSSKELTPTSVYWYNRGRRMVALDKSTGEFSSLVLPEVEDWEFHKENYNLTVTAGHDGTARIVLSGAGGDLKVFARLQDGGEWALEKNIWLSTVTQELPGCHPSYFREAPLIHTAGTPVILVSPWRPRKLWFHLDIETTEVAPAPDPDVNTAYPCELPWPPVFHSCTQLLNV